MTPSSPELVEKVARALFSCPSSKIEDIALAAITAMQPAIDAARREALEEAAKVAENLKATRMHEANEAFEGRDQGSAIICREQGEAANDIAVAIRAIQDRPNGNE